MDMRRRKSKDGFKVHAIAGTYVVLLAMDVEPEMVENRRVKDLLGFAIHRTDHTENESYWLKGFRTFEEVDPNPVPGALITSEKHPIQSFLWGDYTAKPDHDYTYKVVPVFGTPRNLKKASPIIVRIETESEDKGIHAVYFNRGVAGSQAYVRKFGNCKPQKDNPNDPAWEWLSRGLEEAIISFIRKADSDRYRLRASVYEFSHLPVLEAFKAASDAGVDVKIIYDARREEPKGTTLEAVRRCGIRSLMIPRKANRSFISHNKFIVLIKDDQPVEVWTGSTNFTAGGIFGQSNVGHLVRDRAVAEAYLDYWHRLKRDPSAKELRPVNVDHSPDPQGKPATGSISTIFSPRTSLNVLEWYAERMRAARQTLTFTAAFGVNQTLAEVLEEDRDYLRYLILEKKGSTWDQITQDPDVRIALGQFIHQSAVQDGQLIKWLGESLTGLNRHVRYVHTKYMLVDPLTNDPTLITGSANFSNASTKNNDENMLIIQGNERVADIYLGEFIRLFNHFYFRYIASLYKSRESTVRKAAYLAPNDEWTERYFTEGRAQEKERRLFG
jgi:hypothetical protein